MEWIIEVRVIIRTIAPYFSMVEIKLTFSVCLVKIKKFRLDGTYIYIYIYGLSSSYI